MQEISLAAAYDLVACFVRYATNDSDTLKEVGSKAARDASKSNARDDTGSSSALCVKIPL